VTLMPFLRVQPECRRTHLCVKNPDYIKKKHG
jgi:hypothetical protein